MRVFHWRVVLGVFWLVAAQALFFREWLFPEELLANYRGRNLSFGAWLALLLAAWNFARWFQTETIRLRRPARERKPLRPRSETEYEYNPEFDFQKMEQKEQGERPA